MGKAVASHGKAVKKEGRKEQLNRKKEAVQKKENKGSEWNHKVRQWKRSPAWPSSHPGRKVRNPELAEEPCFVKLVHRPEGLVQIGLQVRVVQVQDEDSFAAERPAACVGLLQHSRRTEAAPRSDVLPTNGHRLKGMQKVSGTKKKRGKTVKMKNKGSLTGSPASLVTTWSRRSA